MPTDRIVTTPSPFAVVPPDLCECVGECGRAYAHGQRYDAHHIARGERRRCTAVAGVYYTHYTYDDEAGPALTPEFVAKFLIDNDRAVAPPSFAFAVIVSAVGLHKVPGLAPVEVTRLAEVEWLAPRPRMRADDLGRAIHYYHEGSFGFACQWCRRHRARRDGRVGLPTIEHTWIEAGV